MLEYKVREYIFDNFEALAGLLPIRPIDPMFQDILNHQYELECTSILVDDIVINTGADYDSVIEVLDGQMLQNLIEMRN